MTPVIPARPSGALPRSGWALRDGWTVARRDLAHWASQPGQFIVGLLFPIMVVLVFAYLFGGAMAVPDGGDYREFLLPGMYVLTMAFGVEATFTAVATDASRGITDRFRSLPMSGSAVVSGRCAADMLNSALGLAVMVACGLAVGWRFHGGLGAALAAVGLLLLLRFALLWVGIYLGLLARSPEAVMALQILVWPIGFLSNVFVSPDTMPGWLGALAEWNPLSATATAVRDLFGNPGWGEGTWATRNALLLAIAWPVLLVAVFFPLSVRRYRRLSR
ncbi:ABC transporter permease [Thermostaphylospora chromogena]|uniref:Transport permease protein n=1 Tax=Thermostaphylospora chromogena TaxID=35622 RepID=A0A1H1C1D4_9ACTN|nr:ABC transporter permease [Thermostaphylospora chromogena]SDQ57975.1 ABC transporter efflux protein, DrrB family [Thermostaphylospora chromogena]